MWKFHSVSWLAILLNSATAFAAENPPNIVVMFIDDMGYADIGPFGATSYKTPHLDRMASRGRRFTDFQVSSPVCSASRSALMTGCYHKRISIHGALGPASTHGIHADEMTLAEVCQQKSYATACYGKWHLGHHPKFLPTNHGFDEYYGLPYSNDMWPYHPNVLHLPMKQRLEHWKHLPLIEGTDIVNPQVTGDDQKLLTRQYTERAVDFIERNRDKPFFIYLPHSMVHVPLYVSPQFEGKSGAGLFGDVVTEIDWSMGQILLALKTNGLEENTLVVFTTDNGPWLSYGEHAGSAKPLREGKVTTFEGGGRVPTIMQWPGRIPAGSRCDDLASTIDILPTVAKLIGADLPNHTIDGKDISPLIFGEAGAVSPHDYFYHYFAAGELQAIRDRRWKLHFPHSYLSAREGGKDGLPAGNEQRKIDLSLFDLLNDVSETTDVSAQHPEIVNRLQAAAEGARRDLGDRLTKQKGSGVRPAGKLSADDARLN